MPNNDILSANTPVIEGQSDVFARTWYRFFTSIAQKANILAGAFSTSATAGTASALPALPAGYMTIYDDAGNAKKVPYYNE